MIYNRIESKGDTLLANIAHYLQPRTYEEGKGGRGKKEHPMGELIDQPEGV